MMPRLMALTRAPSRSVELGQRTFIERTPMDLELAMAQHAEYRCQLARSGLEVQTLHDRLDLPDAAFIEDTAVVLEDVAVICRPGTASRREETSAVEQILSKYRSVVRIEQPATLEGGDVLPVGRHLLIGLSSRTSRAGFDALCQIAQRLGYLSVPVPVRGCLHLKTACTALPDQRLLVNPQWIDVHLLEDWQLVHVPSDEPWAANVLTLDGRVGMDVAHHCRTAEILLGLGHELIPFDVSEFAKAEAGLTCLSLIFAAQPERESASE